MLFSNVPFLSPAILLYFGFLIIIFLVANIQTRLEEIETELTELKNRRIQQEVKIENIENLALRQRFQDILHRLLQEQIDKENEKYELLELLKNID